jgi:hypothetical protein
MPSAHTTGRAGEKIATPSRKHLRTGLELRIRTRAGTWRDRFPSTMKPATAAGAGWQRRCSSNRLVDELCRSPSPACQTQSSAPGVSCGNRSRTIIDAGPEAAPTVAFAATASTTEATALRCPCRLSPSQEGHPQKRVSPQGRQCTRPQRNVAPCLWVFLRVPRERTLR